LEAAIDRANESPPKKSAPGAAPVVTPEYENRFTDYDHVEHVEVIPTELEPHEQIDPWLREGVYE
jgi:hypothetical protein